MSRKILLISINTDQSKKFKPEIRVRAEWNDSRGLLQTTKVATIKPRLEMNMALDPHTFMAIMENRIGFTSEDKNLLNAHADWGLTIASEMADHFYAYLGRDPEMSTILNATEGRIHRLRETFIEWFHEMFTGMDSWGNTYADRRWRIGLIHVRIGIGPQHVVPAMATVVREVGKQLKENQKPEALQDALSKICMIDLAFIEQAYIEVSSAAVLRETGWTEGLFRRLVTTGAGIM